eukprot:403118-Pelagomonas_calceolata.AAC.4
MTWGGSVQVRKTAAAAAAALAQCCSLRCGGAPAAAADVQDRAPEAAARWRVRSQGPHSPAARAASPPSPGLPLRAPAAFEASLTDLGPHAHSAPAG